MKPQYQRKFNWERARKLRAQGLSYAEIARKMDVSYMAVYRVTAPGALERMKQARLDWQNSGQCPECGTQTTKTTGKTERRCIACASKLRATTVREDALECQTCREWKPDEQFHHSSAEPARRGRHSQCKKCNTAARRDHRVRNREADNAYSRQYQRRRRWERMTPLQRATARVRPETEEAP